MTDEPQQPESELRPLTPGQTLLIRLAFKEQQRLLQRQKEMYAEADNVGAEASAVMSQAVAAIREDLGLAPGTPVQFEDMNENGKLAVSAASFTPRSPGPKLVKP